jgi:ribose transport system substrate-binding protein
MRSRTAVTLLVVSAAALASAFQVSASAKPAHATATPTIALSNAFLGNDWRQNMENVAKYAAARAPFKSAIKLEIVNTDNSPQAQSASVDGLVAKGVKAIVIDPASSTALNPAIKRACAAGVTVVAFDQAVTEPCAYNVVWDFKTPAYHAALWMAQKMHGKGNIVLDQGAAGASVSADIVKGFKQAMAKYPNIKVVAKFQGNFSAAPTAQAMASILATNPQIDGVYTQGYCSVVISALQRTHRPLVPMYCQGFNINFVTCLKTKGAQCIGNPSPPGISTIAMKVALDVINGKSPKKTTTVSLPLYATDTAPKIGVTYAKMAIGKTAFPKLPPGLTVPAIPPGFGVPAAPPSSMLGK